MNKEKLKKLLSIATEKADEIRRSDNEIRRNAYYLLLTEYLGLAFEEIDKE